MNIRLNLATRPYIELRSVLTRLRAIAAVLILVAIPLFLLLQNEERKASLAEQHLHQVRANIARLQQEQLQARARAETGPDARVLRQAAFLNSLFARKSFSWTATMSDLEDNLPGGVQVVDIEPVIAPNGHVTIQLRVTAERDRAIEVVRNLEHSRHFAGPRLVGEAVASQTRNDTGPMRQVAETGPPKVNFDILATYRPLAGPARPPAAMQEHPGMATLSTPAGAGVPTPRHPPAHAHRRKPSANLAAPQQGGR